MIHSVGTKEKSNFYELWQQHMQLKTMDMSEAGPDIYEPTELTYKIH